MNVFKTRNFLAQLSFAAAALAFVILGGWWIVNNRLGQPENQTAKQDTTAPMNQELPKPIEKQPLENSNAEREVAATSNENKTATQNSEKEQTKKQSVTEPERTPKQAPPSIIASFILTPSLRGNNQIQSLSISKETTNVLLKLELEPDDYTAYRVALVNQSGSKNLWRSGTLKAKGNGENKMLSVSLPAGLLKSQIYSLQVSGISADGTVEIISDYPFKAVR